MIGDTRRAARVGVGGVALACSLTLLAAPAEARPTGPSTTSAPVIGTLAGTGQYGFGGDGGPATGAKLAVPTGTAKDAAGDIYFDDTNNNRVRRVSPAGIITTVAGDGTSGFGGDGGPAKSARLSKPTGIAVDHSGNLYIADTGNNRVRKVTPSGTITTIAGNSGHQIGDNLVHTEDCSQGGNGGPAFAAGLCVPSGVAVDGSGHLYIADTGNNQVRVVVGGTITAFAGTGAPGSSGDGGPATEARLFRPVDVALDGVHDLYIADAANHKVRKVSPSGLITTIAGTGANGYSGDGGPAALATLRNPLGLGTDPLGNVYIADSDNCRIRVVIPKGDIFTYAGTGVCAYSGDGGPAVAARINLPRGSLAVDANSLYFGDAFNNRVRRVQGGPPPNIPEAPFLAVLPLSALALMGAAYLVTRRRRAR